MNTIIITQMLISADTHIRRICRINRGLFILLDKISVSHEIDKKSVQSGKSILANNCNINLYCT